MKFLLSLLLSCIAFGAQAELLTFSDIPWNRDLVEYRDFTWTNFKTHSFQSNGPNGYVNAEKVNGLGIYNPSGKLAAVEKTDGGLFDFNSAALTAAWRDGLEVTVEGWLNGSLVHSQTVIIDTFGPSGIEFNFSSIDKLTFIGTGGIQNPDYKNSSGGYHFTIDNMDFNMTPSVPEPSSYALMMGGLVLIGWMFHHEKHKKRH